jgi:hypothetical protein
METRAESDRSALRVDLDLTEEIICGEETRQSDGHDQQRERSGIARPEDTICSLVVYGPLYVAITTFTDSIAREKV